MQVDSDSIAGNDGYHSVPSGLQSSSDINWFMPPNDGFPYQEIYRPLDLRRREIRLLRLLANKHDTPIECQLINSSSLPSTGSSLSQAGPYDALSYCAGDPNDYHSISVNGHEFNAFTSLCTGLKYLRSPSNDRLVWVDQICIHLRDEIERRSQVLMIKDIYRNATSVQIWLGEASLESNSDLAFDLMDNFWNFNVSCLQQKPQQRLRRLFTVKNFQSQLQSQSTGQDFSIAILENDCEIESPSFAFDREAKWLEDRLHDPAYKTVWAATQHILSRPLWQRCWVIQEIVASTAAQVVCGFKSIEWEHFIAILFALYMVVTVEKVPANSSEIYKSLEDKALGPLLLDTLRLWSSTLSRPPMCLSMLLSCFRTWQSSDPRDKIFSLLGLLDTEQLGAYQLTPDYTRNTTVVDVLVRTSKAIIVTEKNVNILGSVIGDEISQGIPSWTPDWTRPMIHATRNPLGCLNLKLAYENLTPEVEFSEDDRVLRMRVWMFDIIQPEVEYLSDTHAKNHEQRKFVEDAMKSEPFRSKYYHVVLAGGIRGLIPTESMANDKVCIPLGAETAYTIRPRGNSYILVGKAYLWDSTEGKLIENHDNGINSALEISLC